MGCLADAVTAVLFVEHLAALIFQQIKLAGFQIHKVVDIVGDVYIGVWSY